MKSLSVEANRQWLGEVQASGHWRRCQETADGRTGETYPSAQSNKRRTWEALPTRPGEGLDRLRLRWWEGVGAAIVVGDGERPLQGEGPQGLERNLSVRTPTRERSVDV
jgi:hypothetical protein